MRLGLHTGRMLDVSENQALRFNQPAIGKLTKLKCVSCSGSGDGF
jgi:hypothetical protein